MRAGLQKLKNRVKHYVNIIYSDKYGHATDVIIGGSFMMLSDTIAQKLESSLCSNKKQFDSSRVASLGVFGSGTALYQHIFYKWLDQRLPGASKITVVKKVCIDELAMAPVSISLFSLYSGALQSHSVSGAIDNWKRLFVPAYTADLVYWTFFQAINFYYVDTRYRITYLSAVTVLWNTFLCFLDLYKRDFAQKSSQENC